MTKRTIRRRSLLKKRASANKRTNRRQPNKRNLYKRRATRKQNMVVGGDGNTYTITYELTQPTDNSVSFTLKFSSGIDSSTVYNMVYGFLLQYHAFINLNGNTKPTTDLPNFTKNLIDFDNKDIYESGLEIQITYNVTDNLFNKLICKRITNNTQESELYELSMRDTESLEQKPIKQTTIVKLFDDIIQESMKNIDTIASTRFKTHPGDILVITSSSYHTNKNTYTVPVPSATTNTNEVKPEDSTPIPPIENTSTTTELNNP